MHFLVSYPRSGNHFVRFIIEYITAHPTKGCSREDDPVCLNIYPTSNLMKHVNTEYCTIVTKSHSVPKISSSIIFLLREYGIEYILIIFEIRKIHTKFCYIEQGMFYGKRKVLGWIQ